MSYNLLEERWIPVLWSDGRTSRAGIRDALLEACAIRHIAASNPMDNVALLRLLLAVLQWCKPNLTEDERALLNNARGIPNDWLNEKLGTVGQSNEKFELLGKKGGFFQDDTLRESKPISVMNLLHDLPSGSNIAHFRHTRDLREGICLACCALGLARWPGVASAGTAGAGVSMTASINGNAPTYSVPVGANLLATLLQTWPSDRVVDGDAPVWDGSNESSPLGFLKAMTWRSRRVLIAPPDAKGERDLSPGRCYHCGRETDRLVRSILFRPGWTRPSKEPWAEDPHLLRITRRDARSAKGKEKKVVPSWPSPNDPLEDHAGVWRSVLEGHLQRLAASETNALQLQTTLLGISQALYKHVGLHKAALPELGSTVAQLLLSELDWLRQLTWVLIAARGGNWRDPPRGHRIVGALCAPRAKGHAIRSFFSAESVIAESKLENAFLKLMRDLVAINGADSSAQESVLGKWRDEACEILRYQVVKVIDASIPGSSLRRRDAMQRADDAIREAVREIDSATQKKGATT